MSHAPAPPVISIFRHQELRELRDDQKARGGGEGIGGYERLTQPNDVDIVVEGIGDAAQDSEVVGTDGHGPACLAKPRPRWSCLLSQLLQQDTTCEMNPQQSCCIGCPFDC